MFLWIFATAVSYFIKGLCGFANTLVFAAILSFGASNANISPIDLLLGCPTNLILTWKNRKSLVGMRGFWFPRGCECTVKELWKRGKRPGFQRPL